jgi:hypothetical protein
MNQDIIGAISTPPGEGGIAIVRISGEGAIEKINEVFYPKAKGKELIYQKPFTLTLRAISIRAEETFGRLRYSLGGDRPSQTARLKLSLYRITVAG